MAEGSKPCEPNNPRPHNSPGRFRTSGIPHYRCTKPAPPVLVACTPPKIGPGEPNCKCPPNLPIPWSNPQFCVAACPPGSGKKNLPPNGECKCPPELPFFFNNTKCVSACNLTTHMRNDNGDCVPKPIAACPGDQIRNSPRANSPCHCPVERPVFFENRICVQACPPGLGLINSPPNGDCLCPNGLEQRVPNGKCLPICNLQTHMIDSQGNCVAKPAPIDPREPITIETEVQMGGFRQSSIQKKGTFDNAERVSVSINPLTKQVTLGEYVLNGIPQNHGFVSRITGKAVPYKVNGFGYAVNQSGDNLEWQLYIKKIEIGSRKTGTDTKYKGGIVISFWGTKLGLPCEGTRDTPSPVFIVTEGLISYIQGGKKVTTTREVLEQTLLNALLPMPSDPRCKVGGRRNTLKRRNTRKIRGKYKKTKRHRRN